MSDLFVGMYVDIDPENRVGRRNSEGGRGIVTAINNTDISVKYMWSHLTSPRVNQSQIHAADLILTCRQTNTREEATPSLLSHIYGEYCSNQIQIQLEDSQNNNHESITVVEPVITTEFLLSMFFNRHEINKQSCHPAIQ